MTAAFGALCVVVTGAAVFFLLLLRRANARCATLQSELVETRAAFERASADNEALRTTSDRTRETLRHRAESLAMLGHEVRTPLGGIIGTAELLLATNLSPEQLEYARALRTAGSALERVIDDLLDYSKLEAGRVELREADFEPAALLDSVVAMLSAEANAKGLALHSKLAPNVPGLLRGDEGRLRQILLNLARNALKFTEYGRVVLGAVAEEGEAAGGVRLRFAVSDTGIGIPAGLRDSLFEAYRQADGTPTRRYGGTGIGLAMSRSLVEMMRGEIGVASEGGNGSTFWFSVPLAHGASIASAADTEGFRGSRILIVDDNLTDREILFRYLQRWGMHCDTAADAASALQLVVTAGERGEPYAVAVVDYHLPQMDGISLARLLRRDATAEHLPVIIASADHMIGALVHASELTNATTLVKPVHEIPLFKALFAALTTRGDGVTALTPNEGTSGPLRRARILLAEDNAVNALLTLRQLRKLGYASESVSNGREALAALENGAYDLVLMDCHMPVMDGYEATALIRKRERERETRDRLPIVALTANARDDDRARCIAGGMDDYLSKPITLEHLQGVLQRWTFA